MFSPINIALVLLAVIQVTGNGRSVQTSHDRAPSPTVGQSQLSRSARVARANGIDSLFIAKLLRNPTVAFDERFVRINVTNHARKVDYSHNYNAVGVKKTRAFLAEYSLVLAQADSVYGVPAEIIASLLWVETKHGTVLGRSNVAGVFLSVLLSNEREYIDGNTQAVIDAAGLDSTKHDSVRTAVIKRAQKKHHWALDQLKALEAIDKKATLDVTSLQGSWAGAFGISQFLPASYQAWAVDGNKDGSINLFNMEDAIHSVANYLKCNGWGVQTEQQRAAVFHYNNSGAYVDAVLTLAQKVGR